MPIYEFICLDCRNQFEKLQAFSDTTIPRCPQCQSECVQKRLSSPAVHFKGSGWYITDSKNGAKAANNKGGEDTGEKAESTTTPAETAKAESSSTSEGASKTESTPKSETKPIAKEPTA